MSMDNDSNNGHKEVAEEAAVAQRATAERVARLADRLAPAEEQALAGDASVTHSDFKFSKVFADEGVPTSKLLRPHPVVLVILGIALAFMAVMAYLISITPTPAE